MTDSIESLVRFVGLAISVFSAYWVWQDSNRLKKNGVNITPIVWAALVFVFWLVSLPVYLILRRTTWRSHINPLQEVDRPDASPNDTTST
jgi:carbon starvation protein CstA